MPKFYKVIRKQLRKLRRFVRRHPRQAISVGAVLLTAVAIIGYSIYMTQRRLVVDPQSYKPLMSLIARAESSDNYNAYFGNSGNKKIKFTDMTIAEVLDWQDKFVADGSPSSAVGRYQILNTTLRGLVAGGSASMDQKFNKYTQDTLATALLDRRGGEAYVNQEITEDEFAANLAQEWASLPKMVGDQPEKSYYQSNLNAALVKPDKVRSAVKSVESK